jgi:hypothetical protein
VTAPREVAISWSPKGRACLALAALTLAAAGRLVPGLRLAGALLLAGALANRPLRLRLAAPAPEEAR